VELEKWLRVAGKQTLRQIATAHALVSGCPEYWTIQR